MEGWINYVRSDFATLTERKLSSYERAFLMQKRIEITEDGRLSVSNRDNHQKTIAKLCYVLRRFGNYSIPKDSSLWRQLQEAQRIRHAIVHPKAAGPDFKMDLSTANQFIGVTKQVISLIGSKIYRKKLKPWT
jgi:hypothetical protein